MSALHNNSQRFPWKLFWFLFAAGVCAILAIIPFAIDLFGPVISSAPRNSSLPLPLIIALGALQNLLLLAVMIFTGLKLGSPLGLRVPLIEAWLTNETAAEAWKRSVKSGLLTGVVVGGVLLALVFALVPLLPNLPFVGAAKIALWKRILVCLYGGIYEEILTRLCLLTLFAWIASKVWRAEVGKLSWQAFWIANFLAAILFGLGHLPSASLVMPITPLVVAAALSLNGIAALPFGWLYRKYGLESAMVAHFTADIVLYVIGVSFI